MKKILFVINAMGRAGAEQALLALLKSLDPEEIEVSFLSIIDRGEMFAVLPENIILKNPNSSARPMFGHGVRRFLVMKVLSAFVRKGFAFLPKMWYILRRQLRRGKLLPDKLFWPLLAADAPYDGTEYDLAVAYIEGGATYYVADRVKAKRKIAFVHVNYEKAGYIRDFDLPYYEKIDRIFCVSEALRGEFAVVFPELASKVFLSHSIIDFDNILAKSAEGAGFEDDFDGLRILTTSRLVQQKGIDLAVEAFAKIADGCNARWYVLGDGEERGSIERLIKRHGLEARFLLPGRTPNPYPFVAQCDIYVQPSRYEGMGIALLEALALGRPCVTTDFDGAPSLLKDGVNALIVPTDISDIALAVERLINSPELRASLSGHAQNAIAGISGTNNEILSMLYEPSDAPQVSDIPVLPDTREESKQ